MELHALLESADAPDALVAEVKEAELEFDAAWARVARADHRLWLAAVGGTPVTFLFDTGASMVVLTADDARRAGFHADRLDYRVPVMTANGMTQVAPVRLSSLSIGGISVDNVRAAVAKPGDLEASLLGMTFLDRLDGYQVQRDRLVLNP